MEDKKIREFRDTDVLHRDSEGSKEEDNFPIMRAVLVYASEDGIEFRKYRSAEEAQGAMEKEAAAARAELEADNYNDDSFQGWQVIDFTEEIHQAIVRAFRQEVK